ncbi:response regulator [Rhizobium leguminosarum]|uniref:hypothetical protein n=1 Tax=Rhizobium leguminosarum TaxID=384 RepID=UPI001FDFC057|nr:hypothetical protein [Rhizobium leguminosarum]
MAITYIGDRTMAVILVVEDEPLIRFLLSDELADAGHTVIEAASALEAIAVLGDSIIWTA